MEAVGFFQVIVSAVQNGHYLFAGAVLSLAVTLMINKALLPKVHLGRGVLPIISILVGIVGGVGLALINNAEPLPAHLAVLSGPVASSFWDSFAKYFFKKG